VKKEIFRYRKCGKLKRGGVNSRRGASRKPPLFMSRVEGDPEVERLREKCS